MSASQCPRVQALKGALDEEVHGLWISDEMAVKILACVDMATSSALKLASDKRNYFYSQTQSQVDTASDENAI